MLKTVLSALLSVFRPRAALLAEGAVLHQQIVVLQRSVAKPGIHRRDRTVLARGSHVRRGPQVGDHRAARDRCLLASFLLALAEEILVASGTPPADADLRGLIRRFLKENPLCGEDKIPAELGNRGHKISPRTVAKYRPPHLLRNRGQSCPPLSATISIKPGPAISSPSSPFGSRSCTASLSWTWPGG